MIRKLLVNISLRLGLYQNAVNFGRKIIHKKQRKKLKKYGLEALIQADKALKSVDSFFFLDFGTLLGAYRDKRLIAHDCDLDVGILAEKIPGNMSDLLKNFGFKHERKFYFKEDDRTVIDVYSYKGVHLDFFIYFEKGEDLFCHFAKSHETLPPEGANETNGFPTAIRLGNNEGFSQIKLFDYDFYTPANIEQWLIDVYGKSFMIPKKNWFFIEHVEEENLRVEHIKERLYRKDY